MDKANWISKQARKLHSFAVGHSDDSMCRCGRTRWNAVMYKQPRWRNLDMYTNTYTEIGVETCAAVKQNNVRVKSEGWLGVDNCNVQVSCGRDRSMLLPASPRAQRKTFSPRPSAASIFLPSHFLQKHPTSLSTSLHHPTLTLPVWSIRVTRRASSRRRRFLALKRPVHPLQKPVLPPCHHKARARLCSKSSGAILSIDQHTTRNTRAHQPSPRATTP